MIIFCKCGCKRTDICINGYVNGHWNRGKKCSEEKKMKISNKLKGKIGSNLGKKLSAEWRKKISLSMKGRPSWNKGTLGYRKGIPKTTEHKKKIGLANSKLMKTLWKNNDYKKDQISAILRGVCARPNKFETRALAYLNTIYPNKFKYTGNGTLIVNHKSADAYSEKLNTVALFHGCYWHLKRFGLNITEDNKRSVEKVDSAPFLIDGYKVIFIWEDELEKLVMLLN